MRMTPTAAYIRVSTQEQKLHGISLDAQRDKLREYAKGHNLKIVAWYEDEGVSGRKLIKNRPALQEMIRDSKGGQFEHIIFIKLDRFFRSVAEYHEAMKLLGDITWTATEEKYDMTTANGRAFINMKLTIAELEADQTGERIKLVNEYKVKEGRPLSGTLPLGFKIVTCDGVKKIAHDEKGGEQLLDLIAHFKKYRNKNKTCQYNREKYGKIITMHSLNKLLSNPMLYGAYRENPTYCEPYISREEFDELQKLLKRSIKNNSSKVYLFKGLMSCPVCGRKLNGTSYRQGETYYKLYRCVQHYRSPLDCSYNKHINEIKLEKLVLDMIQPLAVATVKKYKIGESKAIKKSSKPLEEELKRLNYMFQKNRISIEDYDRQYETLTAKIEALQAAPELPTPRDYSHLEQLINSDWKSVYNALDDAHKQLFFMRIINRIEFNIDGTISNIFFN